MNGADVGKVERRCRHGLALKAKQHMRVVGNIFGQELQCDKAAQLQVFGFVHHAHAAPAELLGDAVVRDGLADHWRESYVRETGESMTADYRMERFELIGTSFPPLSAAFATS
jgi:hypothetical protein